MVQLGNRGGGFYCKDSLTGSRTSLDTENRAEAERLVQHKNEALRQPLLNRKIGMAYLAGTDSAITKVSGKGAAFYAGGRRAAKMAA